MTSLPASSLLMMDCWTTKVAIPTKVCAAEPLPNLRNGSYWLSVDSDIGLDIGDEDVGFESQEKITNTKNSAYEVDFKVFSPGDIDAAQERLINEVKDVLGQPPEATAILLRYHHWNKEKLLDAYMEHQEDVLEA